MVSPSVSGGLSQSDQLRFMRLEAEADSKYHSGPCLLCGEYRLILQPGRLGGWRVYCEICAIGTRTNATRGQNR